MPSLVENPNSMNTAHEHAENAEVFRAKGLLIPASEEYRKAAEAYLSAEERSTDEAAKRTLKMLHTDHLKAHQQLQRKIDILKQEGKDPTLPQPKPDLSMPGSFNPTATSLPQPSPSIANSYRSVNDLQGTVDGESFMLLGPQKSDPSDAFNHFWSIMQGMLDNLSQPVAFATAPLTIPETSSRPTTPPAPRPLRRDSSLGSEPDIDESLASRLGRRLGFSAEKSRSTSKDRSPPADDDFDEELIDDGDDLSGSFFLIPSSTEASVLKRENTLLKAELDSLKKRLESTDRVYDKLRDSIYLATKEAQRAIGGGPQRPGIDFGSMNPVPQVPVPGFNTPREAQYARKVKELQDELVALRAELEKTRTDNLKHRERWAKIKESHRRKKEAKAVVVRQPIVEEPEAEEAEDKAQAS